MEILGICSRVPNSGTYHYLFFDIDTKCKLTAEVRIMEWLVRELGRVPKGHLWFEGTPHGLHLVVLEKFAFDRALCLLRAAPLVDQKWVEIGAKRGYWFLQTFSPVPSWVSGRVRFMRLKVPEDCDWLSLKKS